MCAHACVSVAFLMHCRLVVLCGVWARPRRIFRADVSTLYSNIADNGYKILYLTERPLGRRHARNRGAEGSLPPGPVLCPPEVLFRNTWAKHQRGDDDEVRSGGGRGRGVALRFRVVFLALL